MVRELFIVTAFIALTSCTHVTSSDTDKILKIEMNLSAFGVESDDFPSIDVRIDFTKDSSICVKSFYNPALKGSTYSLSKSDMEDILNLLNISDLKKLKTDYKVAKTDQPSSRIVIYTNKTKFTINDYGLQGGYPLKDLYKIVFKL